MWITLTLISAVFLGCYDVLKKQALKKNGILWILFVSTLISTLLLSPVLFIRTAPWQDYLRLLPKAFMVTVSWISGLAAIKLLPLTTASTMKASRPVFVVLFSMIIFGERLSPVQWAGVIIVFAALWMLSRSSKKEGISFSRNLGVLWMAVSIISGVASALYDKHIMGRMDPLFVQSCSNLFIAILMGLSLLVTSKCFPKDVRPFSPDWKLILIAVFISVADAAYFFALKQDGALLSVISLIRRSSVIVTFMLSAIILKEKNLRAKAIDLAVLLAGLTILCLAS